MAVDQIFVLIVSADNLTVQYLSTYLDYLQNFQNNSILSQFIF